MSEELFGRYAFYIVAAYGVTLAAFAALAVLAWRRLRRWAMLAREGEKKQAAP